MISCPALSLMERGRDERRGGGLPLGSAISGVTWLRAIDGADEPLRVLEGSVCGTGKPLISTEGDRWG